MIETESSEVLLTTPLTLEFTQSVAEIMQVTASLSAAGNTGGGRPDSEASRAAGGRQPA